MVKRKQRELREAKEKIERPQFDPSLLKKIAAGVAAVVVLYVLVFHIIVPIAGSDPETEEPIPPPPAKVRVLNGCGVSGLADRLSEYLRTNSIEVIDAGNADNFNYPQTIVIEKDTAGHHGKTVADLLGVTNMTYDTGTPDSVNVEVIIGKDYRNFNPFRR